MTIQVQFWDLVMLLLAFLAFVGGMLKLFFAQHERGDRERYKSQESARAENQTRWNSLFDEFDKQLADHGQRIARMEATTEKSPTHEDLAALHRRIDAVAGAINGLQGEFKGASHTLQLIHTYLMNGGKT
ncbi:MAG: hypothetical protein AzoDbin1_04088 [Azoarcus sp.]|nr:hypothetical protein [Azoarcus sp.]